jgi:hypothetical protein
MARWRIDIMVDDSGTRGRTLWFNGPTLVSAIAYGNEACKPGKEWLYQIADECDIAWDYMSGDLRRQAHRKF